MRLRSIYPSTGQPAIRPMIFSLIPVHSPGLGTTKVDKYSRVYIDFDLMIKLGVEIASKYLIHEAWHILRNHFNRGKKINQKKLDAWNVAGDCEINDDIKNVPHNWYVPNSINMSNYKTAEFYFERTKVMFEDGNSAFGPGKSDNQENEDSNNPEIKPQGCGSGAGNPDIDNDYELSNGEAKSRNETEQAVARMITASNILRESVGRGDGSANSLIEWAKIIKRGKQVSWDRVLRTHISHVIDFKSGESETSWNFRSILADSVPEAILPGNADPEITVAVIIDTSGSNLGNIWKAIDQIDSIMRKAEIRGDNLMVLSVDTEANKPILINNLKDIKLVGGGGTDMRVGFDAIMNIKSRKKVDIGIIITDGETLWPEEKPRGNTAWITCITPNSYQSDTSFNDVPTWIKKIIVTDEANY